MDLNISDYQPLNRNHQSSNNCSVHRCSCGLVMDDPLFDRQGAADYLVLKSKGTISVWDSTKRYDLQPIKLGTKDVRYRQSSLDRFLLRHQK